MNSQSTNYERGFILILITLATVGMLWLFAPFMPALFLAILIAIATNSQYNKLQNKFSTNKSALIMTLAVTIVFILPLSYILLISGLEMSILIQEINENFKIAQINEILQNAKSLPLPEFITKNIISFVDNNLNSILISIKDFSIHILKNIVALSSGFVFFLIIVIFSLYYFYIDGEAIIKTIKKISPLQKDLNNTLLSQFSSLAISLIGSVFIIALLQGLVFAIGAQIVGLPALYFGISMAIASFIPLLGGLIIWLPLSIYLYLQGQTIDALIIIIFGGVIIGTIIDNIIRPIIIKKLSSANNKSSALNHTFITVLSTLAGIIQFGILGLFIGPIIAAMTVVIFDVYAKSLAKNQNLK